MAGPQGSSTSREASPILRLAIEFGPLVTFFVTQRQTRDVDPMDMGGLYYATIAFMVAISLSVVTARLVERRWPVVPLVTAVFVLIMGGLTLWLQDETFIKLKPTLVNLLFAGILLVGKLRGRLFLKVVFGEAFRLEERGWERLTERFVAWFLILAGLNEVSRAVLDTDDWTTFKTVGLPVLTFVFMLTLGPLLKQHQVSESS
jgi:intracellular septation protein